MSDVKKKYVNKYIIIVEKTSIAISKKKQQSYNEGLRDTLSSVVCAISLKVA